MEKVEKYKQSPFKFIINEFMVFVSQILVFFMVTVFTSNFFSNETKLISFTQQKINSETWGELGLTFIAILIVIGLFTTAAKIIENEQVEYFIDEILNEMPKTIYFFGSSITGALLAISIFAYLDPNPSVSATQFITITALFSITMFIYGCSFSYAFKRKSHILVKPNKAPQPTSDESAQ